MNYDREDTAHRNWRRAMGVTVLLVCVKLIFSILIKDTEDENTNQLRFVYYWADIPIFCVSSLYLMATIKRIDGVFLSRVIRLLMLMLGLILLATVSSLNKGVDLSTVLTSQSKLFIPIYLLIALNIRPPEVRPSKAVYRLVILVFILSFFAYFFFEPSRNRDTVFWPVYFSGLHTQAYCVFASYLTLHAYVLIVRRNEKLGWLITMVFALVLSVGYGVRTSFFCLVTYILVINFNYGFLVGLRKPFFKFILGLLFMIVLLLFFENINFLSIDSFSSGRMSEYISRIDLISNRGLMDNCFGSGAGFDLMYSDTWWWEEKGSHNDYLTIIIEFGFVYLALFCVFLVYLFRFVGKNFFSVAILMAYLISSLLSNGYMFRPMVSYVLFLSLININASFQSVGFLSKSQRRS